MKAQEGMKVTGFHGYCIGYSITELRWFGEIIRVNGKSIRVKISEHTVSKKHQETSRTTMNQEVTYKFWKKLSDGREVYTSPSRLYGIIEI